MNMDIIYLGYWLDKVHFKAIIGDEDFDYTMGSAYYIPKEHYKLFAVQKKVKSNTNWKTDGKGNFIHYPDPMDILECLYLDRDAGAMSYIDFIDEFGYDDSITAQRTYIACCKTYKRIRELERKNLIKRPEQTDDH